MTSLESQLAQLGYDAQKYHILGDRVGAVVSKLNSVINSASGLELEVKNGFKVDGESAVISCRVFGLKEELEDIANHLSKIVLPAIEAAAGGASGQESKVTSG